MHRRRCSLSSSPAGPARRGTRPTTSSASGTRPGRRAKASRCSGEIPTRWPPLPIRFLVDAVDDEGRSFRAQVHLRRDCVGAGGRTDRRTDRRGSGRLRGDGLGGAGVRPLRMGGRAPPRARRRRSRPRLGGALRPGERPEPQHRPSGLGEDVRPAPGRLQRRTRLGSSRRPGAGQGAATRAPRLHRGGAAAGGPPARILPPRPYPGLPAPTRRERHGAEPVRCHRRPAGGGPRSAAPGQGLSDRPRSGQRTAVAAERRAVRP